MDTKYIKTYSRVVRWFKDLVEDDDVMQTISRESVPAVGKKRKSGSQTLKDRLEDPGTGFGPFKHCKTDQACLRYLLETYLRYHKSKGHDEKKFGVPVMQAINQLLAAMHPLPSQRGGYQTQVALFVEIVRNEMGAKFQKTHQTALQFGGGSESHEARASHLKMNSKKAAAQRLNNNQHLIPIHQRNATLAIWKWWHSTKPMQWALALEELTYARENELLNPRVSQFSKSYKEGYIYQDGVSKQKKRYDGDGELVVPEVRQFHKPIVRIPKRDNPDETYTVDDILAKIEQLREAIGVKEKIAAGWSNVRISRIFQSKDLSAEVQLMFPEAAAYSKAHGRENGISTHFLRKGGMRMAYEDHGLPNESFHAFIARYGGWDVISGLSTSLSYSDTVYVPLLEDLKKLKKVEYERVDILRKAEKEAVELKERCVDATIAETDIISGVNNWRAVVRDGRAKKRKFITLTNGPDKKQKIMYSKSAGVTPVQKRKNVRRIAEQLGLLNIYPVTGGMIKMFGFGPTTIKEALAEEAA
jgi:hypothetical protein